MFLHLRIPGFHAAVHQACVPSLQGRPVAVAVDASDHAPLFATSIEAGVHGIWPGWRAAPARRRCPDLAIVVPDPDLYRRAQRALVEYLMTASPRVGGRAGAVDIDLDGTERVWYRETGTMNPVAQAAWWAQQFHQRITARLHLPVRIGVSRQLLIARLAARAADHQGQQTILVSPGSESSSVASWPTRWISNLSEPAYQIMDGCGITTLGGLWQLGSVGIDNLLGPDDAASVIPLLTGINQPVVPYLTDPEPEVSASRTGGDTGADPVRARSLMQVLAREVGFRLREQGLACTRLTVEGSHVDGRSLTKTQRLDRQCQHDAAIAVVAERLLEPLTRRVAWHRIGLCASGLCAAEDQQDIFAPPRQIRLERARDHLRTRFGDEMVRVAAAAG